MLINLLQFDRFIQELEYAFERVPFYSKHLAAAGLTPDDIIEPEDIQRIPPTEKKDYRRNFPAGVLAAGYKLSDEGLVKSQSSGTSGERLITYELGMLLMDRALTCTGIHPAVEAAFAATPRKICRFAAPNCSDVECANPNSSMQDRMLSDGTLVLPVYHDLLTTPEFMLDRALEEICLYQPNLYYVDPTHFALLMRHAIKRGIRVPQAPLVATYTAITPLNRKQILDAFASFGYTGTVFSALVSSSEMGWLALDCPHGQLHLNSDCYLTELLSGDRITTPGEVGELLISSLDNGAVPHIRYRTGDTFVLKPQDCPCGLPHPAVDWAGRVSEQLSTTEYPHIHPYQIHQAIGAPDWLDLYQFTQLSADKSCLLLIVNQHYQAVKLLDILAPLQQLLGKQHEIEHQLVGYIATERSGKFQCVRAMTDKY
ncbi:hypothetical protein A5320_03895 [Rheinheimera sp. SA_1]|uniref:phenylacetate--CoA ligase family protein n=1 Tax=Rheinheimera sp. SA_1 TaxID=1827365 RepID=UPI000800AA84|nr:phenylacetate--CoA ligase family protein [Rheinheimera sp. SA_1]OBP16548.1 hypothetical protein A5320_03895 [Rheinheimera sp. SA_1]